MAASLAAASISVVPSRRFTVIVQFHGDIRNEDHPAGTRSTPALVGRIATFWLIRMPFATTYLTPFSSLRTRRRSGRDASTALLFLGYAFFCCRRCCTAFPLLTCCASVTPLRWVPVLLAVPSTTTPLTINSAHGVPSGVLGWRKRCRGFFLCACIGGFAFLPAQAVLHLGRLGLACLRLAALLQALVPIASYRFGIFSPSPCSKSFESLQNQAFWYSARPYRPRAQLLKSSKLRISWRASRLRLQALPPLPVRTRFLRVVSAAAAAGVVGSPTPSAAVGNGDRGGRRRVDFQGWGGGAKTETPPTFRFLNW